MMSEEEAKALMTALEELAQAHRGVMKYQILSFLSNGTRYIVKDDNLYIQDKTE